MQMYREREDARQDKETSPFRCSGVAPLLDSVEPKADKELEHYILGSWNTGKGLKKDGLMKKVSLLSCSTGASIELVLTRSVDNLNLYRRHDVPSRLLLLPFGRPFWVAANPVLYALVRLPGDQL